MADKFPDRVKTFTNKVDLIDTIYAAHVNVLQDEVKYLETSLGTNILTSTYSGTFSGTTYDWTTLSDRLANIEAGVATSAGLTTSYVRKTGDTITASVGTVGLLIQPSATSTADIIQTKTSGNSLGFRVDYNAIPYVGNNAVVYVGSSAYNSLAASVADNAITTAKLADGAVTTLKLADNSVTTAKIVNGTIIDEDISASAAIQYTKIAAPTASVSFNNQKITNLGTPTSSTDAATKAYVDANAGAGSFSPFMLAGM